MTQGGRPEGSGPARGPKRASITSAVTDWEVVRRRSTAGAFHALEIPTDSTPQLWIHDVIGPAIVLGSTQRDDVVDGVACARRGIEVVRRRSGGGAVWLAPGEVTWVDVILPAGSPGWADDIHAPMVWLGRHLARAFAAVGVVGASVHDGGMVTTEFSRLICFDGLGLGELTLAGPNGTAKLVGISQRRTRSAARLQCCWYSSYRPEQLVDLLRADIDNDALRPVAIVDAAIAAAVPDALLASLAEAAEGPGPGPR